MWPFKSKTDIALNKLDIAIKVLGLRVTEADLSCRKYQEIELKLGSLLADLNDIKISLPNICLKQD